MPLFEVHCEATITMTAAGETGADAVRAAKAELTECEEFASCSMEIDADKFIASPMGGNDGPPGGDDDDR